MSFIFNLFSVSHFVSSTLIRETLRNRRVRENQINCPDYELITFSSVSPSGEESSPAYHKQIQCRNVKVKFTIFCLTLTDHTVFNTNS